MSLEAATGPEWFDGDRVRTPLGRVAVIVGWHDDRILLRYVEGNKTESMVELKPSLLKLVERGVQSPDAVR